MRQEPSLVSLMLRRNPAPRCCRGPHCPRHRGESTESSASSQQRAGRRGTSAPARGCFRLRRRVAQVRAGDSRTRAACSGRPRLANMRFAGEPSVRCLAPMAAVPHALTHRTGSDQGPGARCPCGLRSRWEPCHLDSTMRSIVRVHAPRTDREQEAGPAVGHVSNSRENGLRLIGDAMGNGRRGVSECRLPGRR